MKDKFLKFLLILSLCISFHLGWELMYTIINKNKPIDMKNVNVEIKNHFYEQGRRQGFILGIMKFAIDVTPKKIDTKRLKYVPHEEYVTFLDNPDYVTILFKDHTLAVYKLPINEGDKIQ